MTRITPILLLVALAASTPACDDSGAQAATPSADPVASSDKKPTSKSAAPKAAPTAKTPKIVGLESGDAFVGSCATVDVDSECADAVAKDDDVAKKHSHEQLAALCKMGKGKVASAPCSSDDVVGSCSATMEFGRDKGDKAFRYVVRYSSKGPKAYSAESAAKNCKKRKGTWIAP